MVDTTTTRCPHCDRVGTVTGWGPEGYQRCTACRLIVLPSDQLKQRRS